MSTTRKHRPEDSTNFSLLLSAAKELLECVEKNPAAGRGKVFLGRLDDLRNAVWCNTAPPVTEDVWDLIHDMPRSYNPREMPEWKARVETALAIRWAHELQ